MTVVVAVITLAEAAGSALAVHMTATGVRMQWILATAGTAVLVTGAAWGSLLFSAVGLSFLAGVAGPLRAATIQRAAADGFRARAASAASACDMLVSTLMLPLAGVWRSRRRGSFSIRA
jgi:hypothetical protein